MYTRYIFRSQISCRDKYIFKNNKLVNYIIGLVRSGIDIREVDTNVDRRDIGLNPAAR